MSACMKNFCRKSCVKHIKFMDHVPNLYLRVAAQPCDLSHFSLNCLQLSHIVVEGGSCNGDRKRGPSSGFGASILAVHCESFCVRVTIENDSQYETFRVNWSKRLYSMIKC